LLKGFGERPACVAGCLGEALKAIDRRLGVIPPIRVTATPVDKVGLALCTRVGT
jgi:hypothetical protein